MCNYKYLDLIVSDGITLHRYFARVVFNTSFYTRFYLPDFSRYIDYRHEQLTYSFDGDVCEVNLN